MKTKKYLKEILKDETMAKKEKIPSDASPVVRKYLKARRKDETRHGKRAKALLEGLQ